MHWQKRDTLTDARSDNSYSKTFATMTHIKSKWAPLEQKENIHSGHLRDILRKIFKTGNVHIIKWLLGFFTLIIAGSLILHKQKDTRKCRAFDLCTPASQPEEARKEGRTIRFTPEINMSSCHACPCITAPLPDISCSVCECSFTNSRCVWRGSSRAFNGIPSVRRDWVMTPSHTWYHTHGATIPETKRWICKA